MKTFLLNVLCVVCVVCTSTAQTPGAKQPKIALCKVDFDSFAMVRSKVMTRSTGSKALDDRLMEIIGKYSHGPSNGSITILIQCTQVEATSAHGKVPVVVAYLDPPYPYGARLSHAQGIGAVRASFDENGNAVGAVMAKSTGDNRLDENSVRYALRFWRSSGGGKATVTIEVEYRLKVGGRR